MAVAAPRVQPWTVYLAVLLLLLALTGLARAYADESPVQLKVGTSPVKVKAGATVGVPVTFTVQQGWHVFAPSQDKDVKPVSVTLAGANGVAPLPVAMPASKRIEVKALSKQADVYEGTVKVLLKLKADAKAAPGARSLAGEFRYQACSDTRCMFPKKIKFTVPVQVIR
jgi:DsbC/DsbD-like thiol-disulfide interchange protein